MRKRERGIIVDYIFEHSRSLAANFIDTLLYFRVEDPDWGGLDFTGIVLLFLYRKWYQTRSSDTALVQKENTRLLRMLEWLAKDYPTNEAWELVMNHRTPKSVHRVIKGRKVNKADPAI